MSELDILRDQLNQARQTRKLAEQIADEKTIKLYQSNKELRKLTEYLEGQVKERTSQLEFTNQYLKQLSKEQRRLIDDALAPIFIVDRQGYVTEYVNALTRYALIHLCAQKVIVRIKINNSNRNTLIFKLPVNFAMIYDTCSRL